MGFFGWGSKKEEEDNKPKIKIDKANLPTIKMSDSINIPKAPKIKTKK